MAHWQQLMYHRICASDMYCSYIPELIKVLHGPRPKNDTHMSNSKRWTS